MLQRIGLAQSIVNDPRLLFLDEPMSGLDPIGRKLIRDLMIELREKGTTIFFNTHILSDVQSICNTISIIYNGRIIIESKEVSDISGSVEDFFIDQIELQQDKILLT
jgi:ABC-2 type transport system ATP-binding protein